MGGWLSGAPARAFLLDAHLRVYTGALFGEVLRSSTPLIYRVQSTLLLGGTAPSTFAPQRLRLLRCKSIHPSMPTPFHNPLGVENRAVAFQELRSNSVRSKLLARAKSDPQLGVWGKRFPLPPIKRRLRSNLRKLLSSTRVTLTESLPPCWGRGQALK